MQDLTALGLQGKGVLVTGASTGIGAAAAQAFAKAGAHVAVHYNASKKAADEVVAAIQRDGGKAFAVGGDFTSSPAVRAAVEEAAKKLGRLDVLVNNAGALVKRVAVTEITDELFDQVMNINARSVVMASAAALPYLKASGDAAIVNVTSIAARNGGAKGSTLYAASKGFVATFTRGLAKELVKEGIRVNALSPGMILTPFQERYNTPEQIKSNAAAIPMGRAGVPDDCVGSILFLASSRMSGYMTGQSLEVNGGNFML